MREERQPRLPSFSPLRPVVGGFHSLTGLLGSRHLLDGPVKVEDVCKGDRPFGRWCPKMNCVSGKRAGRAKSARIYARESNNLVLQIRFANKKNQNHQEQTKLTRKRARGVLEQLLDAGVVRRKGTAHHVRLQPRD